MKYPFRALTAAALASIVFLTGCQQATVPKEALQLSEVSLQKRQLQTRYFDTRDEERILSASASVLQDLGFNIDEAETDLGVIVGSKDRDATEAGQVAGAIFLALMLGVSVAVDDEQKIRVSLVSSPRGSNAGEVAVRVTFQRVVWNTRGQVSQTESLDAPELYQEFFDKLSQSVFLEAQEI
ncbi:hypothetical protein [Algihabitans sp.]|uniref:hypothetical protein n=1 Tax=Algihabitans sp. TaxID=2821514 RepID=UPI003BAA8A14